MGVGCAIGGSESVGQLLFPCTSNIVGAHGLAIQPVQNAGVEELLREVVAQRVAACVGVAKHHASHNHRDDHRQSTLALTMIGGYLVAGTIVKQIVLQRCNKVVRAVATKGTTEVQLVVQVVLLDVAMRGQGHGTALRVA